VTLLSIAKNKETSKQVMSVQSPYWQIPPSPYHSSPGLYRVKKYLFFSASMLDFFRYNKALFKGDGFQMDNSSFTSNKNYIIYFFATFITT